MASPKPIQWYTDDPTGGLPGLYGGELDDTLIKRRLTPKVLLKTLSDTPETAATSAQATPLAPSPAPSVSAAPRRALPRSTGRPTDPSLRPHTAGPIGPNEPNALDSTQATLQGSAGTPPTQSEASEGPFAAQRRQLTQQLNDLQNEPMNYGPQREYMRERGAQGVEALGAALLAGVGPSYARNLQPGFMKQYQESRQPLQVEGGYVSPEGQEVIDPGYQHQKKIEFVSKRIDALNALEQKTLNDQDRRAVERERLQMQHLLGILTAAVGFDRNDASRYAAHARASNANQDYPTGQSPFVDQNGNPYFLTKRGNLGQWVGDQFVITGRGGATGGGGGGPGPMMSPQGGQGMPPQGGPTMPGGATPGAPGQGQVGPQSGQRMYYNKTPLPATEKLALERGGANYQELDTLLGGHHAGMGAGSFQGVPGAAEAMTYWGNKSPWASDDAKERAGWWSQYAEMTNRIRHELFGSAVTKQELIAFNAQMPLQGDHPDQVARKLAFQRAIAAQAVVKLHQAYGNRFESQMLPPLESVRPFVTPPDMNKPYHAKPDPRVLEKSKRSSTYKQYGVQEPQ